MNFEYSDKVNALRTKVRDFIDTHLMPIEAELTEQIENAGPEARWEFPRQLEELKQLAKAQGLWNLWLPDSEHGAGLTNLEYAPLAEIMGRTRFGSQIFNFSAPDTA